LVAGARQIGYLVGCALELPDRHLLVKGRGYASAVRQGRTAATEAGRDPAPERGEERRRQLARFCSVHLTFEIGDLVDRKNSESVKDVLTPKIATRAAPWHAQKKIGVLACIKRRENVARGQVTSSVGDKLIGADSRKARMAKKPIAAAEEESPPAPTARTAAVGDALRAPYRGSPFRNPAAEAARALRKSMATWLIGDNVDEEDQGSSNKPA